ncbi:hypothetical protein QE152_g32135 [Popillia japonica]|uniref:Uncharacterized protein n=1 Tax=Popillia japonica TaxID=7064 RepID=A0AAW1IZS3_POPJA
MKGYTSNVQYESATKERRFKAVISSFASTWKPVKKEDFYFLLRFPPTPSKVYVPYICLHLQISVMPQERFKELVPKTRMSRRILNGFSTNAACVAYASILVSSPYNNTLS